MTRMVRKQIYIPKRQQDLLKRRARARGQSEAEWIRQAIDRNLSGISLVFHADPDAWEKAYKFMLLRGRVKTGDRPYHWKREDAYDERHSH